MLSGNKQNYHHSQLPKIGQVGYLKQDRYIFGINDPLYYRGKQKYIVVAFPLCDNILPYSKGIHTAFFKSLKDNTIHKLSGFYFEEVTA